MTAAAWLHWKPRGRGLLGFAAVVGAVSGLSLAARLFIGGAVGMSDQGDGNRLLCGLGLREGNPYNTSTTNYLYLTWYRHQWYGETCGAGNTNERYHSAQLIFVQLAEWLTPVLHLPGALDLRALGAVFCVVVALLMGGLAAALPGSAAARSVCLAAVLLLLLDGTFAGYFISAYSEPAEFVGILLLVISSLVYLRSPRVTWWSLLFVGLATLFTITAKTQSVSLVATVVPLLLFRARRRPERRADSHRHRPDATRFGRRSLDFLAGRWPALLVCVALLFGSYLYVTGQPAEFEVQNRYAAVFLEMLPHSPHPAQDLQELGLDPSLVSSSGVAIGAPNSAASLPSFAGFAAKASTLATTEIYLEDPERLVQMLGRGLRGMAAFRTNYVYSYPQSAGKGPDATECRVCVVQSAWTWTFGTLPVLILAGILVAVCCCGWLLWTRSRRRHGVAAERPPHDCVPLAMLGVFLAASVIVQFWVVMLTEGASDLIHHLALANFMTVLLFIVAGYAWCLRGAAPESVADPRRYYLPAAVPTPGDELAVAIAVGVAVGDDVGVADGVGVGDRLLASTDELPAFASIPDPVVTPVLRRVIAHRLPPPIETVPEVAGPEQAAPVTAPATTQPPMSVTSASGLPVFFGPSPFATPLDGERATPDDE